jgi:hypothetical protein
MNGSVRASAQLLIRQGVGAAARAIVVLDSPTAADDLA